LKIDSRGRSAQDARAQDHRHSSTLAPISEHPRNGDIAGGGALESPIDYHDIQSAGHDRSHRRVHVA
jgi:hypothetical protein